MKLNELRLGLIDGTIHVIAREGLEKASTKLIGRATSINEAYIYRCFKDKEDMYAKTFAFLDEELVAKAKQHVSVMYLEEMDREKRCRVFFTAAWRFILGNPNKCLTYIRYYYSSYFAKYSAEEHRKRFEPFIDRIKIAFRDEANVWMIMNHALTTMLTFAVRVFDGSVPNDEDTEEHVYRLVYASVGQYFEEER